MCRLRMFEIVMTALTWFMHAGRDAALLPQLLWLLLLLFLFLVAL